MLSDAKGGSGFVAGEGGQRSHHPSPVTRYRLGWSPGQLGQQPLLVLGRDESFGCHVGPAHLCGRQAGLDLPPHLIRLLAGRLFCARHIVDHFNSPSLWVPETAGADAGVSFSIKFYIYKVSG
jgi:hypothetical protein